MLIGEPRIDRPAIPREYGTSKASEFFEWSHVEARLTGDRVYWIATIGPDGRPRVRPIDGLYLDRVIYVGGSPKTRWVRTWQPTRRCRSISTASSRW